MTFESAPETVRPPVFLGCFFAAAALVVVILGGVFFIRFLESGANNGKVRINLPEAYAPGSIEFNGDHNFYLVRFLDGSFVALSDLDAANRANQARRCRAQLATIADPSLGTPADTLSARMTAKASGATTVLRESCNGAVYDIDGARLNGDGANLDQYPVTLGKDGRLLVDTSTRVCSERSGASPFLSRACE